MSMKFQLVTKPLSEVKAEYLVYPLFEGEKCDLKYKAIEDFTKDNPKFGKLFESQTIYLPDFKLLLLGAGKKEKFDFEALQNWAGAAVKQLSKKSKEVSLVAPKGIGLDAEEIGLAIAIGSEIAIYDPAKEYKSQYEGPKLNSLEILVERAERGFLEGIKKGIIESEAINLVRRLGDMPANEMTPTYFLNIAKKIAKENKLKLAVLDEKQAKKKGMGAFVGVAQGSDEPSFMIALEYRGDVKSREKWALVGKGITFDTGGISIKPSDKMHEMKYDMCGAATALGVIAAISKLGLKTNVVATVAVTENLPGSKAQRPGDIVRSYSGKTIEIMNTDAEGRLVLADAIAWANKDFKATKFIDLATLTGAIIVALGDDIAGLFSNNEKLARELLEAAKVRGEKMWQMPLGEDFDDMVKGTMADLENSGHGGSMGWRTASSITGATFIKLSSGIESKPWAHLDIAGVAWDMRSKPFRNVGATGFGVKTLLKLISG